MPSIFYAIEHPHGVDQPIDAWGFRSAERRDAWVAAGARRSLCGWREPVASAPANTPLHPMEQNKTLTAYGLRQLASAERELRALRHGPRAAELSASALGKLDDVLDLLVDAHCGICDGLGLPREVSDA